MSTFFKLCNDEIIKIIKDLSINDIIKLSQTNKNLRKKIFSIDIIKLYCKYNKMLLIVPVENFSVIHFKNYLSYKELEKVIEIKRKSRSESIQQFTKNSITYYYQKDHGSLRIKSTEEDRAIKSKYKALSQMMVTNHNLLGLALKIQYELRLLLHYTLDDRSKHFEKIKINFNSMSSSYGKLIDLFLVKFYCIYINDLLKSLKLLYYGDNLFKQTNFEESYHEEITNKIDELKEKLKSLRSDINHLDDYNISVVLQFFKLKPKETIEDFLKEMEDFVNSNSNVEASDEIKTIL